ncbi:MAG TPA: EutN/CcmL family microcompartment protein [Terriglobales bacterium]|nr:EutN/CcmL family microcompartment protein [Terriglobales bacterium]
MMLARVIGNVVATMKHDALAGRKLLLIQPITRSGQDHGRPLVAVDAVGAGFRETVYWCRGKEASLAFGGVEVPTDASIVGIVDAITPSKSPVETRLAASPGRGAKHPKRGRR